MSRMYSSPLLLTGGSGGVEASEVADEADDDSKGGGLAALNMASSLKSKRGASDTVDDAPKEVAGEPRCGGMPDDAAERHDGPSIAARCTIGGLHGCSAASEGGAPA